MMKDTIHTTVEASETWHFRVPREHIGYVRFLLEAYEGIAQISSQPGQAEVQWTIPAGQREAAAALARALRDEIGLERI